MATSPFPRISLITQPTPLERMARVERDTGHANLWVKHDDVMTIGLGGNKLRSLEFWIGEALARERDILVAFGSIASNQCRLTAAAAAKCGLECVIIYASEEPARYEGNLLLSRLAGADMRFIGPASEELRHEKALEVCDSLRRKGRKPYLIGNQVTGALGYVEGARELLQQMQEKSLDFRHIVMAGSMGPTEAGFLYGLRSSGWNGILHLVSVEYEQPEYERRLLHILKEVERRIGSPPVGDWLENVTIPMDQLGTGYDCETEASKAAALRIARLEGFFAERTYLAKTFAGLFAMIEDGRIPQNESACIIHTGGNPALFSQN